MGKWYSQVIWNGLWEAILLQGLKLVNNLYLAVTKLVCAINSCNEDLQYLTSLPPPLPLHMINLELISKPLSYHFENVLDSMHSHGQR